jgi:hypothetical protein
MKVGVLGCMAERLKVSFLKKKKLLTVVGQMPRLTIYYGVEEVVML